MDKQSLNRKELVCWVALGWIGCVRLSVMGYIKKNSCVLPGSLQGSSSVSFSGSCCCTLSHSYDIQLKLWIIFSQG